MKKIFFDPTNTGKAGRHLLEGGARQQFRKIYKLEGQGGIIHHVNPIREGRFPLPFTQAASGAWNMKWLPGSSKSMKNILHREAHDYLKILDAIDYLRTWTSPVRSGGNAIFQHINLLAGNAISVSDPSMENEYSSPRCLYAPDITVEQTWSASIVGTSDSEIDQPIIEEAPLIGGR